MNEKKIDFEDEERKRIEEDNRKGEENRRRGEYSIRYI